MKRTILAFFLALLHISLCAQQWEFDYSNGESYIVYENGILDTEGNGILVGGCGPTYSDCHPVVMRVESDGTHFKREYDSLGGLMLTDVVQLCNGNYGYLIDYMDQNGCKPDRYYGLDIVPESVEAAKTRFAGRQSCTFHLDPSEIAGADYLVASGVFNIKLDASNADWTEYVLENLKKFDAWTKKGFAVNFLTKYSDPERMALRPDLYYADPCELFDYCKRSFSRNVALLHDYEIYDFTLIVRKS